MEDIVRFSIPKLILVLVGCAASSYASLLPFQNFVGNVAVSTGGLGTTSDGGASPGLGEERADVTSIVAPVINAGAGEAYSFNFTEGSTFNQDGTVLVVVYSNATLPVSTVGILDGAQSSAGDSFFADFATPLDPTAPGFSAEMRLGIGFSFNSGNPATQFANVSVNSTLIGSKAGNFDAGSGSDGALLTIGDDNDPFTPFPAASINDDHERYNLALLSKWAILLSASIP
jgi:hypothetical protein